VLGVRGRNYKMRFHPECWLAYDSWLDFCEVSLMPYFAEKQILEPLANCHDHDGASAQALLVR
jgi:hypothetical protein